LALEAAQLAQVWQQEGAAKELNNLVGRLDSLKLQVVRDAQQLIRVATEIPNGSPPPR
jgi:bifunctional ADP-heptose synthase (sugar kinase/adenylyltransferase)